MYFLKRTPETRNYVSLLLFESNNLNLNKLSLKLVKYPKAIKNECLIEFLALKVTENEESPPQAFI